MFSYWPKFVGSVQFGGIRGRGTDYAHPCWRLFSQLMVGRHLSGGSSFVDLAAAYNRVARQIATRVRCDGELIAALVEGRGCLATCFLVSRFAGLRTDA